MSKKVNENVEEIKNEELKTDVENAEVERESVREKAKNVWDKIKIPVALAVTGIAGFCIGKAVTSGGDDSEDVEFLESDETDDVVVEEF